MPADGFQVADGEGAIVDRINAVRARPFEYGISLGYNAEVLKQKGIYRGTVLDAYDRVESLNHLAEQDNRAAIEHTVTTVPQASSFLKTGNTGAVLSFFNFIDMVAAGDIFIQNLFRQEMNSGAFSYLLSRNYAHLGISAMAGATEDGMNAWFFSLHLGSAELRAEAQLLNLINQFRSNPISVLKDLKTAYPGLYTLSYPLLSLLNTVGFSPLFPDGALSKTARMTASAKVAGTFTGGASALERAQFYGYAGQDVSERIFDETYANDNMANIVTRIFTGMVAAEFREWPQNATILSTGTEDGGTGLALWSGGGNSRVVCLIEAGSEYTDADIASVNDPISLLKRVYGILYQDRNLDGYYTPGEELGGSRVNIFDGNWHRLDTKTTDNAGRFFATLGPGRHYIFKSPDFRDAPIQKVYLQSDKFISLAAPPDLPQKQ
jgi:hypothetical protein